jgi:hypothetical protein
VAVAAGVAQVVAAAVAAGAVTVTDLLTRVNSPSRSFIQGEKVYRLALLTAKPFACFYSPPSLLLLAKIPRKKSRKSR